MTDNEPTGSGVTRRGVLQQLGVAGVGLASAGTVAAMQDDEEDNTEERGKVTFAASAVTHEVEFPSEEVRRLSQVTVNKLPEHAVFEDEGALSYNHLTTRETARGLEANPAQVWHDDYRPLPASDVGSTRSGIIGVDAIDHPRITSGALVKGTYQPPGFNLRQRGQTMRVTVGSQQRDVEPGQRFSQELPSRKVPIKIREPGEGTTEESEDESPVGGQGNRGRSERVEQLTVTPTLHVTNYGELTIRAPEDWTPHEREDPPREVNRR